MAETAIQRLKRLAAEKKALAAPAETVTTSTPTPQVEEVKEVEKEPESRDAIVAEEIVPADVPAELVEPTDPIELTPSVTLQKASRNHPLVREMEELEAALEQNVPGFVTILRDIHKKLAEDPLTVTLLSLEERGTIVKGMTRHANVTIATKAVSKTSSRKKVAISASDL